MSEPESSDGQQPKSTTEPETVAEPETNGNSHLFSVRTTGGQEKIVMRLLEARMKMEQQQAIIWIHKRQIRLVLMMV